MPKLRQTNGLPIEQINHEDLLDMPDVAGVNPDHDSRYYTETEIDTMLSDGTIDHTNLSNIGVNTHAQIDTFIAATVGTINSFGGAVAPIGWLLCNGAVISRITYADLFIAIGTNFNVGGEPGTDFRIPDLRGIFQRGAGTSGQLSDANANAFAGVLGTYQNDKFQGHKVQTVMGSHRHTIIGGVSGGIALYWTTKGMGDYPTYRDYTEYTDLGTKTSTTPITDGVNGAPRTGTETNPANLGVTFIIKY